MKFGNESMRIDQIRTTAQSLKLLLDNEQCTQTVTDNGPIRNSSIANLLDCTDLTGTISKDDDL